jgi:thiamine biosynthesis lipoprotein
VGFLLLILPPDLQKMNNRTKNAIYSLLLIVVFISIWWSRQPKTTTPDPIKISGKTMGTSYNITYFDPQQRDYKSSVDSLLVIVNQSINNYDPESEVSRFNKGAGSFQFVLPYLSAPTKKALEVAQSSDGAFDPTVMPLVYAWGFGSKKDKPIPTKAQIDSIKAFVGFEKVQWSAAQITKTDPRVQLDFGGIGQGYGADVITGFLKSKGIKNMLVELGGEGMACGINLKSGKPWEIGILDPDSKQDSLFFKAYVKLQDKSFTTSGNYFNYRVIDGKKYSHTIDPKTGYQAERAILSASVFAADAITADAWATAFMVMGHEKAMEVLKSHLELDVLFIYNTADGVKTFATAGMSSLIEIKEK